MRKINENTKITLTLSQLKRLVKEAMEQTPTLNDPEVLDIIGSHPKKFFEVMKEFEPYILIRVSANRIEIKLTSDYVNYDKLEDTFDHLKDLGYHPDVNIGNYTLPNGEQHCCLETITIDWST